MNKGLRDLIKDKGLRDLIKKLYGPETASTYPSTGPAQLGYDEYRRALAAGCDRISKARVLEIGCGTGRYFHCLSNMSFFMGLDLSADMLRIADNARKDSLEMKNITSLLMEGDVESVQFVPYSFDFIYSIGVLGEYAPFEQQLCDSIASWLAPGGTAYFTVVDKTAYQQARPKPARPGFREAIRRAVVKSPLPGFMGKYGRKFCRPYDFSQLFKSMDEMVRIFDSCSVPIQYSISQFWDTKHPKLGCLITRTF